MLKKCIHYFLLIVVAGFLVGCVSELTEEELITRAEVHHQSGEFVKAAIDLKTVLQTNRANAEARLLLAKVHLALEDGPSAQKELEFAAKLGVTQPEMSVLLAEALLLQGNFQAVLDQQLPENLSATQRATSLAHRAFAYIGLRDWRRATRALRDADKLVKDMPYVMLGTARLQASRGNINAARSTLASISALDPEYAPAWSFLGALERNLNDNKAALEAYEKAIALVPSDSNYLSRAAVYIELGQLELAQADLNEAKKTVDSSLSLDYHQGLVYYRQGEFERAAPEFEKILKFETNFVPVYFYAGATSYRLGNLEAARSRLNHYLRLESRDNSARRLLAAINLNQAAYAEAEEIARALVETNSDDAIAVSLLANSLQFQGQTAEALQSYKRLAELEPDSASVWANLGQELLNFGEKEEALLAFESALRMDAGNTLALSNLISLYRKANRNDDAVALAEAYVEHTGSTAKSYNLLGGLLAGIEDFDRARAAFEKALAAEPGNPQATNALAALAIRNEDKAAAKKYLEDALSENEDNIVSMLNLANIQLSEQNRDAAEATLTRAVDLHPDDLRARTMLAEIYLEKMQADSAFTLLFDVARTNTDNLALLDVYARTQMQRADYASAIGIIDRMLEIMGSNPKAEVMLAEANLRLGNYDVALEGFREALDRAPGMVSARLLYTDTLLSRQQFESAGKQIELLKEKSADSLQLLELEARYIRQSSGPVAALPFFRKLYNKQKTNFNLLKFANVNWESGRQEQAISLMETWLQEYPGDVLVLYELGARHITRGDDSKAVATFRELHKQLPNNAIALNNLAWLLKEQAPDEAVDFAEQAVTLAPKVAAYRDTQAMVLMQRKEWDKALRTIDKAVTISPDNPTFKFHKALILQSAGENQKSLALVKTLLKDGNNFPERAAAEQLLSELKKKG